MVQPATGAFTAEVRVTRCLFLWARVFPFFGLLDEVLIEKNVAALCEQVTPQDKRGQAEGIRRQASDIVSLSAPIGLGVFADLLSAPGAVGFSAIAMAGTCKAFASCCSAIFLCARRCACPLASLAVASYGAVCVLCAFGADGFFHRTAVGVPEGLETDADGSEPKRDSES